MTDDPSVADLVAASEPAEPRPLGGLLTRLGDAGLVRGARRDDLPIGVNGLADIAVRGVVEDSRLVGEGTLFVAVPGFHVDGTEYVEQAASAGAAAAIVEHAVPAAHVAQLVVGTSRQALAHAAGWWYDDPSRRLGVVGVTGTDGKTTTSFLALAALEAAGISTGLVGTVETKVGETRERHEAHVTTPGAPELQATLAAMAANGNAAVVLETTSHALALDRVLGVAYDAAIFTNLTHEHLDLHGSFEAYRAAKLRLFAALAEGPANPAKTVAGRPWPKVAVVNHDDPAAPWFEAAGREAGATVVTYGAGADAQVRATGVEEDASRLRVRYAAPSGDAALELRLAGRFNVHNALAVVALGEGLGLDPAAVRAGLEGVDGRSRPDGADRPGPAVRGRRRLRALPGIPRDGARPAGAACRGEGRRARRRVRLGRRARHREAGADGPDRG